MQAVLAIGILSLLAAGARSAAQSARPVGTSPSVASAALDKEPSGLPPAPPGRTTIFGGEIRSVDPVRDEFELHVFGQRPMKIFYDDRTRFYRDGSRLSVLDLGSADYASVQTALDGANVFAVSIHILSHSPNGDCEGKVLSYDPRTRELMVSSIESPEPIRLLVPANVPVTRTGQSSFTTRSAGTADLVPGAIISASFESQLGRLDTASRITVLAVPGSSFIFSGKVSYLDLHAGLLVVLDEQDNKRYEIHFNPGSFASSAKLRAGDAVTVTASYDGNRYVARNLAIN